MKNIVVLIHGTWGRGVVPISPEAKWTMENSLIRKMYIKTLGQNTEFETHNWSGRNWVHSREQATVELRKKIEELKNNEENPRIHICAHSHGGNIAMMAAKRFREGVLEILCQSFIIYKIGLNHVREIRL